MAGENDYIAFISYAHGDNVERGKKWADWLKKQIEKYRIPRDLVGDESSEGTVPPRMPEVFLDKSDLPPGGELGEKLEGALRKSRFLLVICSPQSARSHYVDLEIAAFRKTHDWRRVIPIVISGDSEPDSGECWIPKEFLEFIPGVGDIEKRLPLYLDFRTTEDLPDGRKYIASGWTRPVRYGDHLKKEGNYGAAKRRKMLVDYKRVHKEATNKLMSALLGVRPRQLETQADHEEVRRQRSTLGVSVGVAVLMTALAVITFYYYHVAERERVKAERSQQMIGDAYVDGTHLVAACLQELEDKLEPVELQESMSTLQPFIDSFHDVGWSEGEDNDSLHMQSVVLNTQGLLARLTDDQAKAAESFEKSFDIRRSLLKTNPDNELYLHDLAVSYDNLGDLHVAKASELKEMTGGDDEEWINEYIRAVSDYRESLSLVKNLLAQDGTKSQWHHDLVVSHFKIGSAYSGLDDMKKALKEFLTGLPEAETLAASDPDYTKWQALVGAYCYEIGRIQGLAGEFDKALDSLTKGQSVFHQLREKGLLTSHYEKWLKQIDDGLTDLK